MPYKTGIRLLSVARNPANGFPARLLGLNPSNRKSLASLAGRLVRLHTLRPNLPSFPQRTEGCLTAGPKFTWLAYALPLETRTETVCRIGSLFQTPSDRNLVDHHRSLPARFMQWNGVRARVAVNFQDLTRVDVSTAHKHADEI